MPDHCTVEIRPAAVHAGTAPASCRMQSILWLQGGQAAQPHDSHIIVPEDMEMREL